MGWVWTLLAGAVIGFIAGMISDSGKSGLIYNIIAGLIGSSLGQSLFGARGPQLAGMAIIPAVLGAIIFNAIVGLIFKNSK